MTDKEFKKLKRSEMIEIIYQLQKREKLYLAELESLREQLELKRLKIDKAGSIAEAVVGLSDIFAKAQEIADRYLEEVSASNSDAQAQAEKIISDAHFQARGIIEQAQQDSEAIRNQAKTGIMKSTEK